MSEELPSVVSFTQDISEAEPPPALPAQDYEAEIRAVAPKVSQNSGNTYAEVMFYIDPSQYPVDFDVENAPDGKTIPYRRVLLTDNQQARYRIRKFCEAIGAAMGRDIDLNDWIGLRASVTIQHESVEGVDRENIVKVSAID